MVSQRHGAHAKAGRKLSHVPASKELLLTLHSWLGSGIIGNKMNAEAAGQARCVHVDASATLHPSP